MRFYHAEEPHQSIIKVFLQNALILILEEKFLRQYGISESLLNLSVNKNLDAKLLMLKIHSELRANDAERFFHQNSVSQYAQSNENFQQFESQNGSKTARTFK